MKQLNTKDDLYHHMEMFHEDLYQGIMEVAQLMSYPLGETGVSCAQGLARWVNVIKYK